MKILPIQIIMVAFAVELYAVQGVPFTHQRFAELVGSKYVAAIKTYNGILNWMLSTLEDFDPELTVPKPIDSSVKKASDNFVKYLEVASKNAETMSNEANAEMEKISASVSKLEGDIRAQNAKIVTNKVNVDQKQKALNLALQHLNTAQANLQAHRNALAEAEKKKHKAKYKCVRRRRFRRGLFKKIKKAIKKVERKVRKGIKSAERKVRKGIKGTICKTVDVFTGHIKKAKKDVKNAEHGVNVAQQAQAKAVADKNTAVQQLSAAQAAGKRMQDEKVKLVATLASAKQKRDNLIDVSANLKKTVQQINRLKGSAEVLKFNFQADYLLDPGLVLAPLRDVGLKVATLQGSPKTAGFLPKLSDAQIAGIRQKLMTLKEKGDISAEVPDSEDEFGSIDDLIDIDGSDSELSPSAKKKTSGQPDHGEDIVDTNVLLTSDVDSVVSKGDARVSIDDDDDIIDTNI